MTAIYNGVRYRIGADEGFNCVRLHPMGQHPLGGEYAGFLVSKSDPLLVMDAA